MSWGSLLDQARRGEGPLKYAQAWWRAALRFCPLPRFIAGSCLLNEGFDSGLCRRSPRRCTESP